MVSWSRLARGCRVFRWLGGVLVPMAVVASALGAASADLIPVRAREGNVYSPLVLLSADGEALANGELIQSVRENRAESRLTFHFKDGSLQDEHIAFTQSRVFKVVSHRMVQRGPAFPHELRSSFERESGRYTVRFRDTTKSGPEEHHEGQLDLPDDVYNGMATVLVRNLEGRGARGHLLAFTPKPRLLRMELVPSGEDTFWVGPVERQASKYQVKLEVPGVMGLAASLIGKDPPDLMYWIVQSPVPAFLKFEGAFFLKGPTWRVEPARPRWTR
jgi:hypothetical protein